MLGDLNWLFHRGYLLVYTIYCMSLSSSSTSIHYAQIVRCG